MTNRVDFQLYIHYVNSFSFVNPEHSWKGQTKLYQKFAFYHFRC